MSNSRVLMVVPTLGQRLDYLRLTLESLREQNFDYDTVLVVPLENQEAINLGKEFDADFVDDPGGLSAAVNAGIQYAKDHHEFIGWIGDDDLLRPNSLNEGVRALDANPKAVIAYGYCDYIDDEGRILFTNKTGKLAPWLMTWGPNLVPCPGAVFRKSAFDEVGHFDEDNKYCMDLDMLLRLRKVGKFINTKSVLAAFRWHNESQTVSNRKSVLAETEKVKRKYMVKYIRVFSPLWEPLVRVATNFAHKRVNARMDSIAKSQ